MDCSGLHSRASVINESMICSDACGASLNARRTLQIQYALCSAQRDVLKSGVGCGSLGREKRFAFAQLYTSGSAGRSSQILRAVRRISIRKEEQQGTWTLKPVSGSLCKGERMEGGGKNDILVTDGPCYSHSPDQADMIRNLKASQPGLICPAEIVGKATNIVWQECIVKKEDRQKMLGQKGCVIWMTGLSGSGKSTLACAIDHLLYRRGNLSYVLDGDNLRHGLNKNLGFSLEDRAENVRRIGEVAKVLVDTGVICIASAISPYRKDRDACRKLFQPGEFLEVYMKFPLEVCEGRDPKGLYKLARAGKIKGFTGIDDPYEEPLNCEIVMEPLSGKCPTPGEMASQLLSYLEERGFLGPLPGTI